MEKPTKEALFESARKMMTAEFEKAKAEVPHYGERGAEVEQVLITWLNNQLPKRFAATSGFIMDDFDSISPQTDVIIYDALNCPILRHSSKTLIIPSDHAAVAIEVKSNLTKQALSDGADKIAAIKSLPKLPISDLDLVPKGADKIIQRLTMGVVFAFESSANLRTIAQWYADLLTKPDANGRHIDLVYVLDQGWLDLGVNNPQDGGIMAIHSPGPIYQFSGPNAPNELWVACHEIPERVLLSFFFRLTSHLQMFRTKMYVPSKDVYSGGQTKLFVVGVGNLPEKPKNANLVKRIQLIKNAEFSSKGIKRKRKR